MPTQNSTPAPARAVAMDVTVSGGHNVDVPFGVWPESGSRRSPRRRETAGDEVRTLRGVIPRSRRSRRVAVRRRIVVRIKPRRRQRRSQPRPARSVRSGSRWRGTDPGRRRPSRRGGSDAGRRETATGRVPTPSEDRSSRFRERPGSVRCRTAARTPDWVRSTYASCSAMVCSFC